MKAYFFKYKDWLILWQLSLFILTGLDILVAFFMQNVTDNSLNSEWIKLIQSIIFGILYIFFYLALII